MPLKRDGTDNVIDLYLEYVGQSEVPPQYHLWSCLSMLAAAVSNRVWLEKTPGKPLAPNLYVTLIGPSAIGKNVAVDSMLDVIRDQPKINMFKGKITAPALLDQLAVPAKGHGVPWSHIYLVTPELAWSMGKGDWADALVKQLTELYGGSADAVRELTRTHGALRIKAGELCINWISGSTQAWLANVIPPDAISGGFFGRMVVVPADYNFDVRYVRPIVPTDHALLLAMLRARIRALTSLTGLFTMEPAAVAVETAWYNERPAPGDPDLYAAFKRQHDFMLKLCMLMSLADGDSLRISAATVASAQRLSDSVIRKMASVVGVGTMTAETRGIGIASDYLKRYTGPVPHSVVLKYMSGRGYDAEGMRRVMVTLVEMKRVRATATARGRFYEWTVSTQKYTPEPPAPESANGAGDPEPPLASD